MLRPLVLALALPFTALAAGPAESLLTAIQKKDAKAGAALLKPSVRYGAAGRDTTLPQPAEKVLGKIFKGLEQTFKGLPTEAFDCTRAGRELGFMATEWQESNAALAEWVRGLAERHCEGTESAPPTFHFVKRLDGDRPHSIVVIEGGGDVPELSGFYHF